MTIAKNELNEELQAIVKAQQEQLRVQNAKVSTLSATTRRLELQNKKLQNELKEKDEEMPISSLYTPTDEIDRNHSRSIKTLKKGSTPAMKIQAQPPLKLLQVCQRI